MMTMQMRKTYTYKLYSTKRTKHLDELVEISREIWNYCLALQKRYYRIFGKYIPPYSMKKHLTKVKHRKKYLHWCRLGSQAIQDVVERQDRSFRAFFDWCRTRSGPRKSPPKFRKHGRYHSFTLKQSGWSVRGNVITVCGYSFKFWKHREFHGNVKTVTIKSNAMGEYFVYFSVIEEIEVPDVHAGNAVGIDFGLKTFLTLSDGTKIDSPQWFRNGLAEVQTASRAVSHKHKCSKNRRRALHALEKVHDDIANRRRDWFFKLAAELTKRYSVICIEDLNLKGMQRLWGRKVSDLAYGEFVSILGYEAAVNGCQLVVIDRWFPSSKACHCCGYVKEDLNLKDRGWTCPSCGAVHDRDVNAAVNILEQGLSLRFGSTAS